MLRFICLSLVFGSAANAQPAKMAVMPITAQRVSQEVVHILDEILLNAASNAKQYRVIGASDISTMLGLERYKDALNCNSTSCAAEIGGALGVSFLLSVQVGVVGG